MGQTLEITVATRDRVQFRKDPQRHLEFLGLSRTGEGDNFDPQGGRESGKIGLTQRAGMFYLAGRDSHYRPIVVVDAEKIISAELTE